MTASRTGQAALGVAISLAVALALLAAQVAAGAKHLDMGVLTRDAAFVAGAKWYAGFFSNLGLMAWGAAAALGGFGWWHLRGHPPTRPLAAATSRKPSCSSPGSS